jgi:hypothetical protein
MMKTLLRFFLASVLVSSTMCPAGFDDLFGGGGDPFAGFEGFDFRNMDSMFGDMSLDDEGADPFASLFNQGSDGPAGSSSSFEDSSFSSPQKKEITPPVATSLEEAFKNSLDAKVTKLTPQYKKALDEYLAPLITQLQILSAHCSSFSLGIKLKTELEPHAVAITNALQLITKLHKNSVYHILFLTKEFSSIREKLLKALPDITAINNEFEKLPTDTTDLAKVQNTAQKSAQKKLFSRIEEFHKKVITPLTTDLTKLFDHKQATAAIKERQKKYAALVKGSQASASGGWSSSANNYFNDGFDFGGYGGGGGSSWNDGGGDFWNSFGGGADFGGSSWGDYGDGSGGSYDNWSSSDWSSSYKSGSSSSMPSSSSSQTSSYVASSPSRSASYDDDFSFDSSDSSPKKSSTMGAYMPPKEPDISELEPVDQIKKLITLTQSHITAWPLTPNKNEIKKLLETPAFAADIERITRVMILAAQNTNSLSSELMAQYTTFKDTLEKAVSVCVDAATYASPPFASLFEEQARLTSKKVSLQEVRDGIEKAKRQRQYAYQKLLQLLGVIRAQESSTTLYAAILEKLQKHAYITLKNIEAFYEQEKKSRFLSLEQLIQITTLSRQLFHEPVAIGYAKVLEQKEESDGEAPAKQQEKLAALRTKKQEVTESIAPLISKNYALYHTTITLLQEAVMAVRTDLKLADDQAFVPNHINAIQALAAKVETLLSSESYATHEYQADIRALLLPYDKKRYEHIEIQHALLTELLQWWNGVKPEATVAEDEARGDDIEDVENTTEYGIDTNIEPIENDIRSDEAMAIEI